LYLTRKTKLANRADGRPAAGRTGIDSHDHERHGDTEVALASLWRSRSRQLADYRFDPLARSRVGRPRIGEPCFGDDAPAGAASRSIAVFV
jgi:hypothetical protein